MTDLRKAAEQALGYPSLYDITGDIKGLNTLLVPVEEVKQLEEMNRQLREQNTSLDAECGRLEAENTALREALAAPVVPPGYALVPVEPTREMVWACKDRFIPRIALPFFVAAYKTMIAAAPQPKDKP